MLRRTYDHLFWMGLKTPVGQRNGPFELISSPTDEQPGWREGQSGLSTVAARGRGLCAWPKGGPLTPPVSHIVISLSTVWFADGKNQKKSRSVSFALVLTGSDPAYDSPTSKSTFGRPLPLTENPGARR